MSEQSGKPGRYQRSASGLVAALLVTVVSLLLLIWFMGLFRTEPEFEPESVDYLAAIEGAQAGGLRPTYPASLPEGWIATGFDVEPGEGAAFGLKLLTDDDRFVGISQSEESVTALLRIHVDADEEKLSEVDGYTTEKSVARQWEGYVDEGGDTAFAAELGEENVLVYGSASAEELQALIDLLTTDPVPN